MIGAKSFRMTLREFRAIDGARWMVWHVKAGSAGYVQGTPAEWLAFQNEDGSERCRVRDIPVDWNELSDERLDLLRRTCVPITATRDRYSPPDAVAHVDPIEGEK